MSNRASLERELWRILEPVHAAVYFVPDAKAAYGAVGLRGYWMGYFASRSAALGAPSPRLVTALFYGFAPRMVERALPDAWRFADPARVLDIRLELARNALAGHAGADLADAADLLTSVLATLDVAGRPLAAAHLDLPVPDDPLSQVWHAATVLREYRGDGHVAELVAAQVDGAECHILHGGSLVPQQREFRGWTEQEWADAAERLRGRGLVDDTGAQTPLGRELRAEIEWGTDRSAAGALRTLGDAELQVLRSTLGPVAESLAAAGAVPYPNAMGVARPSS
jgi:helix-turn-helix protein